MKTPRLPGGGVFAAVNSLHGIGRCPVGADIEWNSSLGNDCFTWRRKGCVVYSDLSCDQGDTKWVLRNLLMNIPTLHDMHGRCMFVFILCRDFMGVHSSRLQALGSNSHETSFVSLRFTMFSPTRKPPPSDESSDPWPLVRGYVVGSLVFGEGVRPRRPRGERSR